MSVSHSIGTKKTIVRKISLGLSNRDGEILIAEASDGTCYLVAEADTFGNEETLKGLGSTEEIEISRAAFDALANNPKLQPVPAEELGEGKSMEIYSDYEAEEIEMLKDENASLRAKIEQFRALSRGTGETLVKAAQVRV